jgi:predicted Zn-dependent protease
VIEQLLEHADHVELLRERQEVLRFGSSRITYQHSENKLTVRARRGAVWVTLTRPDPEVLRRRFEDVPRGEATAPDEDGELRTAPTAFAATERAVPDDRVAYFREALAGLPDDARLGGSVAHSVVEQQIANVAGLRREERRTRARVQLIASRGGASSYTLALHRDAAQLVPPAGLADGLDPLPLRALEPGRYRAALGPQAMTVLVATLAQYAFHPTEGTFCDRLGEPVVGENVWLHDDGASADGMPTGFDCAGTRKRRVDLIANGVATGVVGVETGHVVPPAWRFGGGPSPSHVFLASGDCAHLAAACETGLSIQRVDYVRMMNAKETRVTGSSRDATLWLEGGRAVARVPQFRFTLRLDELFSSLEAIGTERERNETPFMESVVAPGAVATAFPVDVVTG